MKCSKCGYDVFSNEFDFCPMCGENLEVELIEKDTEEINVQEYEESNKVNGVATVLDIAAIGIFIGGFIVGIILGSLEGDFNSYLYGRNVSDFSSIAAIKCWLFSFVSSVIVFGLSKIIQLLASLVESK